MRLLIATSCVALMGAVSALTVGAAPSPSPGFGSASCLRGQWGASQAETKRVLRALAPVPGLEPTGKLYMIFRGGTFQYGTTSLVLKMDLGDATLTARARFFTLQRYTANAGTFTTRGGESTIEYGPMTGMKDGRTYTVAGPPTRTTRVPGGTTPFQCRGNTLKVRLPRFASLDWITLQRR
jgi:hypothetical protein